MRIISFKATICSVSDDCSKELNFRTEEANGYSISYYMQFQDHLYQQTVFMAIEFYVIGFVITRVMLSSDGTNGSLFWRSTHDAVGTLADRSSFLLLPHACLLISEGARRKSLLAVIP